MGKKIKTKIKTQKNKIGKFDVKFIKKLIKNELYSHYHSQNIKKENILSSFYSQNEKEEKEKIYYNKYTKYMGEEFNSTIVNMLITFINKNKDFPKEYQNEPYFINKFINLIKRLLMSEFEFSAFTILLDKMGWTYENMDRWMYFCILAIYTKKLIVGEEESSFFIEIFETKNDNFIENYSLIDGEEKIKNIEKNDLSIRSINERFKLLTRPVNSYCRRNFINYNGVVDKIVKLSQPYKINGNQLTINEIPDLDISNNIDNNINNNNELNMMKEGQPNVFNNYSNKNKINNQFSSLFQSIIPTNLIGQSKMINNPFMSRFSIGDFNNNQNLYMNMNPNLSLNLYNRQSSQFSLKSESNMPNNYSKNIN